MSLLMAVDAKDGPDGEASDKALAEFYKAEPELHEEYNSKEAMEKRKMTTSLVQLMYAGARDGMEKTKLRLTPYVSVLSLQTPLENPLNGQRCVSS